MKIVKYLYSVAVVAIAAVCLIAPVAVYADTPTTGLSTTVTVNTSATLILTPTSGSTQTLTFTGIAGQNGISPTEGDYQVEAQISAKDGDSPTLTVSSTGFTGGGDGAVLAASNLTYYSTRVSSNGVSGEAWNGTSGSPLTAVNSVLANFNGSGDYVGTQTYLLSIPYGTAAEIYTGTVTYTIGSYT